MSASAPARRRCAVHGAFGLMLGLLGGALCFFEAQCRSFERLASEDFRLVAFLRRGLDERGRKVLEESLRALPELEEVRYVGPEESIAALRREDPELFESVALLGENPLPAAFELKPGRDGFARVPQLVAEVFSSRDVAEVRYKNAQAAGVLHARFYAHFAGLAVNAALTLAALAALAGLWLGRGQAAGGGDALWSGLGSLAGQGAVWLMARPMQAHVPWWSSPGPWRTLLVTLAAAGAAWAFGVLRAPQARSGDMGPAAA